MVATWSLSGVDTARWRAQARTQWRPPVSARWESLVVPGRHGAIVSGLPVFDVPELTLELLLRGESVDLESAQAELAALLSAPDLTVTRSSGGVVASAPARLVSLALAEFVFGVAARFQVTIAIPGVFLRGTVATSPTTVVASGATVEISHLAPSSGPVADAIVRVTGPATVVSVADVVTGTGLSLSGAGLASGSYLYLDAGRLRAWRSASASAWTPSGTDLSALIDFPAAGPLQIWPRMRATNPADRVASLCVTGSGFGSTTAVTVRAAPSYL